MIYITFTNNYMNKLKKICEKYITEPKQAKIILCEKWCFKKFTAVILI